MAIALVASLASGPGANGGTTAAIDTTGATLLVLSASWGGSVAAVAISDSKGNTWVSVPAVVSGPMRQQFAYCFSPTVGTGHTFTVTGTGALPAVVVHAFSGTAGLAYQTRTHGVAGSGGFSRDAGTITPSGDGALVLTGLVFNPTGTVTGTAIAPVSFAYTLQNTVTSTTYYGAAAYYVQPTRAAVSPVWSWSSTGLESVAATIVFSASVPSTLSNPLAYWAFGEASGSTAVDASGNAHTATFITATWDTTALKKFGAAALKSTGSGRGASFTPVQLGTVHSIAFWMNGWNGSTAGVVIGGLDAFYASYIDSTLIYYSAGSGNLKSLTHGGLTGSHHIVITRSGTTLTWYKDGTLLGTQTLTTNTPLTLATLGNYDVTNSGFPATLDDIRFYDVALSGAEVSALYALTPADPAAASVRVTQSATEILAGTTAALVAVPNLAGLSVAAATTALTAVGLTLGTVTGDPSGVVISQSPTAGTFVAGGSAVNITVAVPAAESARVTQAVVELLSYVTDTGHVTQLVVEVFHPVLVAARTTQLAVEVFHPILVPTRATQFAVEYFAQPLTALRATHVIVEVFRPPVLPGPCPVDLPLDADSVNDCAIDFPTDPDVVPY